MLSSGWVGNCGIFEAALGYGKENGKNGEPAKTVLETGEKVVDAVEDNCRKNCGNKRPFIPDSINKESAQTGTGHVNYV